MVKELIANNSRIASLDDIKKVLFPDKPEGYLISIFNHLNGHLPRLLVSEPDPSPELFMANDYMTAYYYNGDFTASFEEKEKERDEKEEKKRLELEKLKFDVKNTKRIYNTY